MVLCMCFLSEFSRLITGPTWGSWPLLGIDVLAAMGCGLCGRCFAMWAVLRVAA